MTTSEQRELVTIQLDHQLQQNLAVLCDQYQIDFSDLVNAAMLEYLANHGFSLDALVDGYTAAAQVNEDLVHEFAACDNDVTAQL